MAEIIRISPEGTRNKVLSGEALLIGAYSDEAKFDFYHLEGAISLSHFKTQIEKLEKDQELIFY